MSVRKFLTSTGHNCLKMLKYWSTTIQNRCHRKKFYNSTFSISTHERGSISTEVTVLDFDTTPCVCQNYQKERAQNELNENIELRWRYNYY
ncbi:hypothetical protein Zmor_002713 [Zophobas morio]|uniref:Uncharacterized protein n=1 Tax=Zophobas morio TaxID=2755281 RepID=A0AA38M0J8_9CUCU|nr:hypothetical protein Zmor_002713 [Zophobas morio]